MPLKIVIEPYALLWPAAFSNEGHRLYRGPVGYIVDTDAPCEDVFLKDQDHKLRDITAEEIAEYEKKFGQDVAPGKIELPMALAAIAAKNNDVPFEPFTVADKVEENAAAAALALEADALGIPDPEPAEGVWGTEQ